MSFEADLNRIVKKTSDKLDRVVRKTAADMFKSVILMTPRDTGRAQGNWNTSINKTDTSTSESTSAGESLSSVAKVTDKYEKGDTIILANSLPYIRALEYGHSEIQAPSGMVRITVARFKSILGDAVRAVT